MDGTRDSYDAVAATYDDERLHQVDWHGHRVDLDRHRRRRPDTVADLLTAAGLEVRARLVREPEPAESARRCYLLARRPG